LEAILVKEKKKKLYFDLPWAILPFAKPITHDSPQRAESTQWSKLQSAEIDGEREADLHVALK
jgi:hypothetical protein